MMRSKVANSDKATGQLQHAGRQKQGWNPLLPDAENRFSKSSVSCETYKAHCNCSPGTVAKYLLIALGKQGGAVLFAPPRKAVAFLTTLSVCQKDGTGNFAACGQRSGLLALNLASIFKKLLEQKTFICLRLIFYNHIRLLPVYQKTAAESLRQRFSF